MNDEVELQRKYYADTAAHYDDMHMEGDAEHHMALAWLSSLIGLHDIQSLLDIGSGTGRTLRYLRDKHDIKTVGIEPVEDLRIRGHEAGLSTNELIDGDVLKLDFPDNHFDIVCEFAVLHHIKDHHRAVSEMCRVAKRGVFISDSNNFGQGRPLVRLVKQGINALGLWQAYDYLATKGKGYHWSEGDGVYYSYSVFNDMKILRSKFPNLHFMSTKPSGHNLYKSAPHLAVFAESPQSQ